MAHETTRISSAAHGILKRLSKEEGKPMSTLVDEAVEALRRRRFLEGVNAAYAKLRREPDTWEAIESERRAWDATLPDGLEVAEGRAEYRARARRGRAAKK
jgi:predicted DNA-binding protein